MVTTEGPLYVSPGSGVVHAPGCRISRQGYHRDYDPAKGHLTPGVVAHPACLPDGLPQPSRPPAEAAQPLSEHERIDALARVIEGAIADRLDFAPQSWGTDEIPEDAWVNLSRAAAVAVRKWENGQVAGTA